MEEAFVKFTLWWRKELLLLINWLTSYELNALNVDESYLVTCQICQVLPPKPTKIFYYMMCCFSKIV